MVDGAEKSVGLRRPEDGVRPLNLLGALRVQDLANGFDTVRDLG